MDDKLKAYLEAAHTLAKAKELQAKSEDDLAKSYANFGRVLREEARKRLYISIGVFVLALVAVTTNPDSMWPIMLLFFGLFAPQELGVILTHRRFIFESYLRTKNHGTK